MTADNPLAEPISPLASDLGGVELPPSWWPRRQLLEIEDQPWCPPTLRCYLTDCLCFLFTFFLGRTPVAARLANLLERTGERHLVDLCSGSSGPLGGVLESLATDHGLDVTATLTDLYPNARCYDRLRVESGGRLDGLCSSVDARDVPSHLDGVRTLFSGLHHFEPTEARAILADAAEQRRAIAVFEVSERHPRLFPVLALLPAAVMLMTPWLRPRTRTRWLLTYVVPIIPLVVFWDGLVSCCRTYTINELEALVDGLESPGYRFTMGQDRVRGLPARITWLIGCPDPTDLSTR